MIMNSKLKIEQTLRSETSYTNKTYALYSTLRHLATARGI